MDLRYKNLKDKPKAFRLLFDRMVAFHVQRGVAVPQEDRRMEEA